MCYAIQRQASSNILNDDDDNNDNEFSALRQIQPMSSSQKLKYGLQIIITKVILNIW